MPSLNVPFVKPNAEQVHQLPAIQNHMPSPAQQILHLPVEPASDAVHQQFTAQQALQLPIQPIQQQAVSDGLTLQPLPQQPLPIQMFTNTNEQPLMALN